MKRYLKHIRAERYGGLSNCEVGPFSSGLNVVFGPNEAGKSTLSSLVRGVLFGWEEAHGVRNTYHPPKGGRSGALEFAPYAPEACGTVLSRDEWEVRGDTTIAGDIDCTTFDEVFSFSAEELRSLGSSSDVTARLLTAASGTSSSPSAAFVEVERCIAMTTGEVIELGEDVERESERIRGAVDQAELFKQKDRELRELQVARAAALERIDALNGEIGDFIAWKSELESLDRRSEELRSHIESLYAERRELSVGPQVECAIDSCLFELDPAEERVLRDHLDEYAEQQNKNERSLDAAKENSATSTAAYEALVELDEESKNGGDARGSGAHVANWVRVIVAVLLPIVFVVAGIPLFIHGREIASLSFTALGLGLIGCAILVVVAAALALFRPPTGESSLEAKRKDAQWVMLQDRKKLDACMAEQERLQGEIATFLDKSGLSAAEGSLRQAYSLLDTVGEQRSVKASADQRLSSIDLRIRVAREQLSDAMAARRRIVDAAEVGHDPGGSGASSGARELDALVRKRTVERDALVESVDGMARRIGELTSELDQAKRDDSLSLAKLKRCELRARLEDRKNELSELLLAKRMLERSIAAWENQRQPEVYDQAGRLLAIMTDGVWTRVSTSATGSLVAIDGSGVERDPRHLSLGTCQQLYLALRVALLLTARDIGKGVPVLADDVLVNFDANRRVGAGRVLAELAQERQVIVFTCHEETVSALMAADSNAFRIDL